MSRHRVKNIDYDSEDLDDEYDDYEEEEEQVSPEDKEQLRQGTIKVREVLGVEPIATDAEIQESLWHYYYDVEKTVNYLLSKQMPSQPKKSSPLAPQTSKVPPIYTHPRSATTNTQLSSSLSPPSLPRLSAASFFADCPWFQVPPERLATLTAVEPLFTPRGLLGGNPTAAEGKMSKVAALAAARKKKLADQKSQQTTPNAGASNALDKLSSAGRNPTALGEALPRPITVTSRRSSEKQVTLPTRAKQPNTKRMREPEAQPTCSPLDLAADVPASKKQILNNAEALPIYNIKDLQAEPSDFARIIVGDSESEVPFVPPFSLDLEYAIYGRHFNKAKLFDFVEPSPDAAVLDAQKGKAPGKATSKQANNKGKDDLSNGVKQLKIEEPVTIKSKNLDVLAEFKKTQRKRAANFVVIGHVDAGKSTLMGRLLYDLKAIDARTIEKYKKEAERIGKGSFAFAWVLDQGSEERARGVTIDIAMNKFETDNASFTIVDAPGHRDFVPNMIAGASQADFAVLVIDASTGNFESGLVGQTKEHALLVRSMGVQKIIVAVNKMDTNDWSSDRFEEIKTQMLSFLTTAGFQPKKISFIPCSGLEGDFITRRSDSPSAKWYTGPTLVEELEASEPTEHAVEKPLRMTVGDVFRGAVQNPLSISGRLESGSLQAGDQIVVMPDGEKAFIRTLLVDNEPADWAVAGQNLTLNLTDIDPIHLKVGDVVCSPLAPVKNITTFTAKVLSFAHLTPMHVEVHRGRLHVPGRISQLVATLDKATGEPSKKRPKLVAPQNVARIVVELEQAVPLEGGRVVLRANGETVAAGLVE